MVSHLFTCKFNMTKNFPHTLFDRHYVLLITSIVVHGTLPR